MPTTVTRAHVAKHVPRKLQRRVLLYGIIAVIIIGIIISRLLRDGGNALYPIAVFLIGFIVGIFLARMFRVSWDHEGEKVVSRLDTYGALFIVGYIVLEMFGEHYIRHFFNGPMISTMILSLVGGALLGRGIGIARMILQVLRKNI